MTAISAGLQRGRFIEDALDTLCRALGAASAWSTLESKRGGPVQRARTSNFYGASPTLVAEHVTRVLGEVPKKRRAIAAAVPYAANGSFVAVPLWSEPPGPRRQATLVGALYLDFPGDEGLQSSVIEFLECTAGLIGAVIAQQELVEKARETLRERSAKQDHPQVLELDDLLSSPSMRTIRDEVRAAIRSRASILILGESGTGKTQLASAIARASNQTPIVRATLGFSDDLNTITSELFGHERGSFSGAVSKRTGLVEYANKGTLILDEVLNLPPHGQQLLLDFTQFGTYRPLGYQGREPKKAEVRLISVTNGDMDRAIADTRFRQDLYFRLATVPLVLPPLRHRRRDIPEIARRYLKKADPSQNWQLADDALQSLTSSELEWTGNIRELEAVLERARNRASASDEHADVIEARHLDLERASRARTTSASSDTAEPRGTQAPEGARDRWIRLAEQRAELDALERTIIQDALAECKGVVAKTARELSVARTSLISRMDALEIKAHEEPAERSERTERTR
ncbi:MAG: sigma 54-interacting transcriptional regulator [Myxococcota bacterium]